MHQHGPRPPVSRVVSLLWFPFFFVAAFSLMGFAAFSSPAPHGVRVDVVGSAAQADRIAAALDAVRADGFVVRAASTAEAGRADLMDQTASAVYVPGAQPTLLVASAGSAAKANLLAGVFAKVTGDPGLQRVDVVPNAVGDVSGVSLLFVGLPLLLVGLITALVLLQFAMWSIPTKALVLAATGAFATAFVYLLAVGLQVVPGDPWLLLFGFLLTQCIGWIATGAAGFVRQFFLPFAMTFVLILQVPTAGATVAGDLLPGFLRWLNGVMPLAQFIDLARSSAYFGGSALLRPLLTLIDWVVVGAVLMVAADATARRRVRAAAAALTSEADEAALETGSGRGALTGIVLDTAEAPIASAHVVLLDASSGGTASTRTDAAGRYRLGPLPTGTHHLLITAAHCEPLITTVVVHEPEHDAKQHDFVLVDWDDPAANLTAEDAGERDAPISGGAAGR